MARIFFVDDRPNEILRLWELSGCEACDHELLPLEKFCSVERSLEQIEILYPDVVVVGHGLSVLDVTGSDVIRALRRQGYAGYIIANSGGGIAPFKRDNVEVDGNSERKPCELKRLLERLTGGKMGWDHELLDAEERCKRALQKSETSSENINRAMSAFMEMRRSARSHHGNWVHSLSHFIEDLWKLRQTDWIKKVHEVAFRGARSGDTGCSDRLVVAFGKCSLWSDDPADFHMTEDNISWGVESLAKYHSYALARVRAVRFEKEEDFIFWYFRVALTLKDYEGELNYFSLLGRQFELQLYQGEKHSRIGDLVRRLRELGVDPGEFSDIERRSILDYRAWLEQRLEKIGGRSEFLEEQLLASAAALEALDE